MTGVTEVSISNLALAHHAVKGGITSIDPPDNHTYSKVCKRFIKSVIGQTLQRYDWDFARKRKALTAVTVDDDDKPGEYDYAFQYPTDCLQARFLIETEDSDNNTMPFKREGQYIFCNVEDATLVYTQSISDLGYASYMFESAASMLLASLITGDVKGGDKKTKDYWYKMWLQEISVAAALDGNEATDDEQNDYVSDRISDR